MVIKMFNHWYFLWLSLSAGGIIGLYYGLKDKSTKTQKIVLFSFLAFGLLCHFLKAFIPPYSVDEARKFRDSWFINICGANIALFPFLFFSKNKYVKDYMFYIGLISGLIVLFYPQEPLAKQDQLGEFWDILRFYYHHWMIMAVPLLMVLLKHHNLSWKRILCAPTGLLILMLFIILNQVLMSELGFIPLRDDNMFEVNFKNTSYIWGPDLPDGIGKFLSLFCPDFFKIIPVGPYAGQEKYWPWFWLIFPAYILVTPMAFAICMIFDHKNFKNDVIRYYGNIKLFIEKRKTKNLNNGDT